MTTRCWRVVEFGLRFRVGLDFNGDGFSCRGICDKRNGLTKNFRARSPRELNVAHAFEFGFDINDPLLIAMPHSAYPINQEQNPHPKQNYDA